MTDRIDWPALMRAGIGGLGLRPEEFWGLTPAELTMMLGRGIDQMRPLGRAGLNGLMVQFPDDGTEGT